MCGEILVERVFSISIESLIKLRIEIVNEGLYV